MAFLYRCFSLSLIALLLAPLAACQSQGEIHPKKAHFSDAASWPKIRPGAVTLNQFQPFRAVYERKYTQGLGPKAGEPRTDQVIITAERVGWDGEAAIAITVIDTGDPQYDDTAFRSLSMVISEADLRLLFEMGPIPGTGKDYYIARVLEDQVALHQVTTDTSKTVFQEIPLMASGFGPGSWVIANLALHKGMKVQLDPMISPRSNPLTGFSAIGYVSGQGSYTSLSGTTYEAWLVDHTNNPTNSRIGRRYLINQPPYYLGTETIDLDTGVANDFLRLIDVTLLTP